MRSIFNFSTASISDLNRKKKLLVLTSVILVLEIVFYCYSQKCHPQLHIQTINQNESNIDFHKDRDLSDLNIELKKKLKQATNEKVILVWDPPFGKVVELKTNKTECGACHVTCNKLMVDHPDTKAVVFHFSELITTTLPVNRRTDQYYTFYTMESPSSLVCSFYDKLKIHDGTFNLSMSHRQDSDVWAPYGSILHMMKSITPLQKDDQYVNKLIKNKRKLALWLVSNCNYTAGAIRRMNYVLDLQKEGLRIDLGGKCFPHGVKEFKFKDYKFYFAFENSFHCRDYITEKFFANAITNEIVPVVFGAYKADYERVAPPNSFIYAQDYTKQELVELLNHLDRDDIAYKKYFEWRKIPIEVLKERNRATGYCQLCRILHGINYDDIFHRNHNNKFGNLSLFENEQSIRIVPSVTKWFFEEENKDCMENALFGDSALFFTNSRIVIANLVIATIIIFLCNIKDFRQIFSKFIRTKVDAVISLINQCLVSVSTLQKVVTRNC